MMQAAQSMTTTPQALPQTTGSFVAIPQFQFQPTQLGAADVPVATGGNGCATGGSQVVSGGNVCAAGGSVTASDGRVNTTTSSRKPSKGRKVSSKKRSKKGGCC